MDQPRRGHLRPCIPVGQKVPRAAGRRCYDGSAEERAVRPPHPGQLAHKNLTELYNAVYRWKGN
jgi:hypothetical protein